jgi:hypothetical protein
MKMKAPGTPGIGSGTLGTYGAGSTTGASCEGAGGEFESLFAFSHPVSTKAAPSANPATVRMSNRLLTGRLCSAATQSVVVLVIVLVPDLRGAIVVIVVDLAGGHVARGQQERGSGEQGSGGDLAPCQVLQHVFSSVGC